MKSLHRDDLFGWSVFQPDKDIDFNSVAWAREEGVILVDPLPLSEHDRAHLDRLGGVEWIVVTNSDHVRASGQLAAELGALVAGPAAEREGFPLGVDRWLAAEEELVPGLVTLPVEGSKTPGELNLLLEETTLITGDLIRAHRGGSLMLLPAPKLRDGDKAVASVRDLLRYTSVEAVLVGDGWPVFRDGHARLRELVASLDAQA